VTTERSATIRRILLRLRPQLVILLILIGLELAQRLGLIPRPAALLEELRGFVSHHGWSLLLLVSFVEHLAGVNVYFPGSVVIFVSVSSLAGKPWLAGRAVLATAIGAIVAHQVNYFLGGRLRGPKSSLPTLQDEDGRRGGWKQIIPLFLALWHPHFGALATMIAGREAMSYSTATITVVVGVVCWQAVWALIAYNMGAAVRSNTIGVLPLVLCVVVWAAIDVLRYRRSARVDGSNIDSRSAARDHT
jgi:membrane protein DedA with SNARE-associated domain